MSPYWSEVRSHLYQFGYKNDATEKLLYRLKIYEEAEINIRDNKFPSSKQIRPFYYFKSCDVKLIRDIIYDKYPDLKFLVPKIQWIMFDFLTEIIDDVEDEIEDRTVYNGNRFLFSLYSKGVDQTISEYQNFVSKIEKSFNNFADDFVPQIKDATLEVISSARELLDDYEFKENPKFILEHIF